MFFYDLPNVTPIMEERILCSIHAAVKYQVPANIVLAVAEKENGQPGQYIQNENGTVDVGPMQFNTRYLSDLSKFGITPEDVAAKGCYPYELATWRLYKHIKDDSGDLWTKASNYHSRTPEKNYEYKIDLIKKAKKWEIWLGKHFKTIE